MQEAQKPPYNTSRQHSPNPPSTSGEHQPLSLVTPLCTALCMYDLHTNDPDQLSFNKGELLEIVRKEGTGWWAALRHGSDSVGWVPEVFVKPISIDMANKLRVILPEELRLYEYGAEQLDAQASISQVYPFHESDTDQSYHGAGLNADRSPFEQAEPGAPRETHRQNWSLDDIRYLDSSPPEPFSSSTPVIYPSGSGPLRMHFNRHDAAERVLSIGDRLRERAGTVPGPHILRRGHMGGPKQTRLSSDEPEMKGTDCNFEVPRPSETWSREEKIRKLTGSNEAWLFHQSVQARRQMPWYRRPAYSSQLQLDAEGQVRYATVKALVEKLATEPHIIDPLERARDTKYQTVFLTTFRTFITADRLFEMLVDNFWMNRPEGTNDEEFEDWKTARLLPTQRRILMIFTSWLENHQLLEEEPHIAQKLTDFLGLLLSSRSLASMAKDIIQKIERLTFAEHPVVSPVPAQNTKKSRPKSELLKLDPADVAEQLAIMEYKLYVRISPQECFAYRNSYPEPAVANLSAFCSTHDRLGAWVKMSILNTETLGRRADTVDFWIKVGEKCRYLNNFSSMSAIIGALSSTVITQLHSTWAHVRRNGILQSLLKHNDPAGGFSGYRNLLSNIEGPCIPFIGMYLTDIAHIQDQYPDEKNLINFRQRQRWYQVVSAVLRYQSKPYNIVESDSISAYIHANLREGSLKDGEWFWTRSNEVQKLELAHANTHRGQI
ncbi:hypothetical protein AX17_000821 [Amanita inopinata Kibby_2008]|nr:hypothetical protein AX17_000821 [Amanita inopinata Kibby_2008]